MDLTQAAICIVYAPINNTTDADAVRVLVKADIHEHLILDLQDAAHEVAHVGRLMTRHHANMAIDADYHGQFANRLDRQLQAAQAKLTHAWHAIVPAEEAARDPGDGAGAAVTAPEVRRTTR